MISSNEDSVNTFNIFNPFLKKSNLDKEKEYLFNKKYDYFLKNSNKNKINEKPPKILKLSTKENKNVEITSNEIKTLLLGSQNNRNITAKTENRNARENDCFIYQSANNKNYNVEKEEENLINFGMKKIKKTNIVKKDYIKILSFIDENNNIKKFKLFKDSDLGFGKEYKIKNLYQDNDINSDDELIKRGVNKSLLNISKAIKLIKNKDEEIAGKYLKYIGKN